jgi:hypothetical protein
MRRLILVLAMIGMAVLLASGAALGITGGTVDGTKHPNVGALVDTFDGETYPYCTGTLIAPRIVVTAAHCYPEPPPNFVRVDVTFEPVYKESSKLYSGRFIDPGDFPSDKIGIDIAVVKLDEPVSGITPARLPRLHKFDDEPRGSEFTAVGYGGYLAPKEPGGPLILYEDRREYAVTTLNQVNRTYLRLSQKNGGGTCYGDSGGPNFYGAGTSETNVIASTTITGDAWCRNTNVTLRLDAEAAQKFLAHFSGDGVTIP